jgi:AraC family transcriptional regulator
LRASISIARNVKTRRTSSPIIPPSMPPERDLLHLLQDIRGRLSGDLSLQALATRSGWSPFHLHRAFQRVVGETPKEYTLRLRIERAAGRLTTSGESVIDIAIDAGFTSHEVFTRAFRRHFGRSPARYRVFALKARRPRHEGVTRS